MSKSGLQIVVAIEFKSLPEVKADCRMGCLKEVKEAAMNPPCIVQIPMTVTGKTKALVPQILEHINKTEVRLRSRSKIAQGRVTVDSPYVQSIENVTISIDGEVLSGWWKTWALKDEWECRQQACYRLKDYQEKGLDPLIYQ